MKKIVLLIAVLSLFAAACKSDTTVAIGAEGAESSTSDAEPTVAPTDDSRDADDAGDPTPAPTPTPATAAEPTAVAATAVPTQPPSAPLALAPSAVEAIQAVVDADDWCAAANAVENGTSSLDTLDFTNPVAVEQGVTQSLAVISASKRLVPDELADDLDTSIEAFTILETALKDVGWNFLDLDLSIIDSLDARMELATYNIEAYNFTECGIGEDPGLPPVILEDGTIEGSTDELEFDGTVRDQAIAGLVQAGFSAAEASCIIDNLDLSDPAALSDPSAMLGVFADCDISLDRLAQLGG